MRKGRIDEMFISDEVTGNGSKDGYPLTQDEIVECLNGNVKLLLDAMRDLECDITSVGKGFTEYGLKYFDTIIRCFILDEVLNEVIKELWY